MAMSDNQTGRRQIGRQNRENGHHGERHGDEHKHNATQRRGSAPDRDFVMGADWLISGDLRRIDSSDSRRVRSVSGGMRYSIRHGNRDKLRSGGWLPPIMNLRAHNHGERTPMPTATRGIGMGTPHRLTTHRRPPRGVTLNGEPRVRSARKRRCLNRLACSTLAVARK